MIPESITYKDKQYQKSRKVPITNPRSLKYIFLKIHEIQRPLPQTFNIPIDYMGPGRPSWTIFHVHGPKMFSLTVCFFLRSVKNTQTESSLPYNK